MAAKTVYELVDLLERYHQQRRETYKKLAEEGTDSRAVLLLEHLVGLEDRAIAIIHEERNRLPPGATTYLLSGPKLTAKPPHAVDCRCEGEPSFDDALRCALTSDGALDEVIDHIQSSSAAGSVQELAKRLREVERTKDREIAKFTRPD